MRAIKTLSRNRLLNIFKEEDSLNYQVKLKDFILFTIPSHT